MGEGLKRIAKECGGLTVKSGGKTVKYDANGRKLGPYGCLCQTMRHKLVGDGCDLCNKDKSI